eukprot:6175793-Pleurochrysis_carterae.AAC.1
MADSTLTRLRRPSASGEGRVLYACFTSIILLSGGYQKCVMKLRCGAVSKNYCNFSWPSWEDDVLCGAVSAVRMLCPLAGIQTTAISKQVLISVHDSAAAETARRVGGGRTCCCVRCEAAANVAAHAGSTRVSGPGA